MGSPRKPWASLPRAETSQFATLDEAIAYVGDWLGRIVAQVTQSKRTATRE